jgi:seryl-tRNA synthetase
VAAVEKFMLDNHDNAGIEIIEPPVIVNKEALINTGQLPKFKEDLYELDNGQFLIPTAEVPLTNLVANKMLSEQELPIRYAAATNCFRQEAGAAGRDNRGLIRVHQFRKVELVTIGRPQDEEEDFKTMLSQSTSLLDQLEIPYRVIQLCTGDASFTSAMTYDIEV